LSYNGTSMPHNAIMIYNGTGKGEVIILETKFPWGVYVPPIPGGSGGGSGSTTAPTPSGPVWSNCGWGYRQQLTVTTGASGVSSNYSASVTLDHAALVGAGKSLANGNDLRVMYWNGGSWTELSRALDPLSSWNNASTKIWFPLATAIPASSLDNSYYLYYGDAGAGAPPADWANVFRIGDEFSKSGTSSITETGGELFIDMGTAETDSGIVITANPLPASKQFIIRHKTKIVSLGGTSNPELKGLGIYQLATQPGVTTSALENPRRRITMYHRFDGGSWINYNNSAAVDYSWVGGSWQSGYSSWGPLSLDTYYIYELVSDGTSWYTRVSDASSTVLTTTTPITWANTQNTGTSWWFYWGDPYTGYYYGDQKSDWVYLRDYVNPEPTSSLGTEQAAASFCTPTPTPTPTPTLGFPW
ncbi:MAG: hypothetical protein LUQ67_07470, partial [Methanomicrobiales archaeon]|nr:hypothetical protein [Methanomicrobiales archaeon]